MAANILEFFIAAFRIGWLVAVTDFEVVFMRDTLSHSKNGDQ
jgi:hypothetical protein